MTCQLPRLPILAQLTFAGAFMNPNTPKQIQSFQIPIIQKYMVMLSSVHSPRFFHAVATDQADIMF